MYANVSTNIERKRIMLIATLHVLTVCLFRCPVADFEQRLGRTWRHHRADDWWRRESQLQEPRHELGVGPDGSLPAGGGRRRPCHHHGLRVILNIPVHVNALPNSGSISLMLILELLDRDFAWLFHYYQNSHLKCCFHQKRGVLSVRSPPCPLSTFPLQGHFWIVGVIAYI